MDLINLAIAKKIAGSGGGSTGGGGADILNENGIIKQQHLPEGYPYAVSENGYILPETHCIISPAEEGIASGEIDAPVSLTESLTDGKVYTVNWNGVDYDCVATDGMPIVGEALIFLGNFDKLIGNGDNKIPFCLVSVNGVVVVNTFVEERADVTVSIRGFTETVTPIAKKYLPAGFPYAEPAVFLPETTPVFSEDAGGFVIMSGVDASMFTDGQTYTVNWNGTNYETRAMLTSDNGMNAIILGDMGAMQGVPTTGEPFAVMILDAAAQASMGIAALVIPIDGSASVTLSIIGETLTPVDAKFLPNAPVFVDVYGTIGGTYEGYGEKTENISKQSHTNAEILALAKLGKNVIIRNYDSETGTAFKCYNLSEVDFNFARFTKVYFSSSDGIGSTIEVLINGKMSMQETKFA